MGRTCETDIAMLPAGIELSLVILWNIIHERWIPGRYFGLQWEFCHFSWPCDSSLWPGEFFLPKRSFYCMEGTVLTLSAFLLPPLQWHPGKCGDLPAFQPGWSLELHRHLCHSPLEYLHLKTQRTPPKKQLSKENKPQNTTATPRENGEKKLNQHHQNNKQKIPPKNSTRKKKSVSNPSPSRDFGCRRKVLFHVKGKETKPIRWNICETLHSISPGMNSLENANREFQ